MDLEIFEIDTTTTTTDDNNNNNTMLWYSHNEINSMKSKMSIFVKHMRNKKFVIIMIM